MVLGFRPGSVEHSLDLSGSMPTDTIHSIAKLLRLHTRLLS